MMMKYSSLCVVGDIIFLLANLFLFTSSSVFVLSCVVSESMMPTVLKGDYVISCQFIPGWRLAYTDQDKVLIKRMLSFSVIQRNDIVMFNFPFINNGWKMIYNTGNYYIKRCVGLPGDSLLREDGKWNVDSKFGLRETIYIPKQGDTILLNKDNCMLYWQCIDYETGMDLECRDSTFFLCGRKLDYYIFKKNYYFMLGDNWINSNDSRYWGILPEDFIVGKLLFICCSIDPKTKRLRYGRIGKKL